MLFDGGSIPQLDLLGKAIGAASSDLDLQLLAAANLSHWFSIFCIANVCTYVQKGSETLLVILSVFAILEAQLSACFLEIL